MPAPIKHTPPYRLGGQARGAVFGVCIMLLPISKKASPMPFILEHGRVRRRPEIPFDKLDGRQYSSHGFPPLTAGMTMGVKT